jgi:NADH-quinone oxidoreductase subunit F
MRHNPYRLVEGLLIAARTVGARRGFIALKSSFTTEADRVSRAVREIAAAAWAPDVSVDIVLGPSEYLFGEEKGLLEVIEGEDPLPRLFPPYIYGLFTTSPQMGWSAGRTLDGGSATGANPTLVNNVETLSAVPLVVGRGGEWYRSMGTPDSPGTIVCTVSGDTVRHGVDEFELGTPVGDIIEAVGGGVPAGRRIRYVLSGVANPVLAGDRLATPASYEGMEAAGSGLGTGGFIVYDDRTDPLALAAAVTRFLWVESCGQCPACKLGLGELAAQLEGRAGDVLDLTVLAARLSRIDDAARCYLPTEEQRVLGSLIPEIRAGTRRVAEQAVSMTTLVDLVGDRFTLDERQLRKRPDWTYEDE